MSKTHNTDLRKQQAESVIVLQPCCSTNPSKYFIFMQTLHFANQSGVLCTPYIFLIRLKQAYALLHQVQNFEKRNHFCCLVQDHGSDIIQKIFWLIVLDTDLSPRTWFEQL